MTPPPCQVRRAGREGLEVADIVRDHLDAYQQRYWLGADQKTVVRDLMRCRTAALGGHLEVTHALESRRKLLTTRSHPLSSLKITRRM